jgi:HAD superfamily hydrolase (TIGR01509 family)
VITSVIFDLDGLLADTERLHCQAYKDVLGQYGLTVTDVQFAEHWTRAGKGISEWIKEKDLPLDIPLIRKQKSERYLELVESSVQPMEGAFTLLERLSGKITLALASSAYQHWVEPVLRCLDITHYFEKIVSGDSVSRSKPFPDIFLYTAQKLGVQPSQCVVLEDAEKGVLAARQAGMKCIAVPNEYTRDNDFSQATRVVSSLNEITLDFLNTLT